MVVSLYSVLLLLALRMHKSRYGGSYTGDPSARSSNLRLSLISKRSKSSKSNVSTTVSSSSTVSVVKANRRRMRRQEMAEYKAKLPGTEDTEAAAKLIRYTAQEDDPRPLARGSDVTEKLEEGRTPQEGDLLEREEGGVATTSPPGSVASHTQDDAAPGVTNISSDVDDVVEDEGAQADAEQGEEDNYTAGGRCVSSSTDGTRSHVSIDTAGHGIDGQDDGVIANGVTENTENRDVSSGADAEEGREYHKSLGEGKVDDDGPPASTNGAMVTRHTTEMTESRPGSESDTLDDVTADDTAAEDPDVPPPAAARRAWFPSKYVNRVMTETRDKVLFLKKCRAVKTVFLIIISFTATYVPFVVGTMAYSLESEKHVCLLHALSTLLYCAVVANSLANPLIYAYGYREFRMKTKKFKGIFAREKPRKVV